VIKKMGIDHYFLCDVEKPERWYAIIGATDITKHKPDPEVWIKCAELFEIPPHQCLVIEDHLPGLTGAKQCGAIGIYYHHFCKPDKACMEIAEKSVESFSELLD
jgi:beta-phosphoglucomutase-like phosphatase (HAD superfamily)